MYVCIDAHLYVYRHVCVYMHTCTYTLCTWIVPFVNSPQPFSAGASLVLLCFFICKACWISAFLPEPSWPPVDHRGITIMKGTADHSWSATWADVDNLSTSIEDGSTTPLRLNWLYLSPAQRLFKATLNLHQSCLTCAHTHSLFQNYKKKSSSQKYKFCSKCFPRHVEIHCTAHRHLQTWRTKAAPELEWCCST